MKLSEKKLPIAIKQCRRGRIVWYFFVLLLFLFAVYLWNFYFSLGVLSVVPMLLIGFSFFLLVLLEYKRMVNSIVIDSNKITLKEGLFNLHTTVAYFSNITDIKISQHIWEQLFWYGKLYINTPGRDEYEIVMEKIPNPHNIREFIEKLKHKKT